MGFGFGVILFLAGTALVALCLEAIPSPSGEMQGGDPAGHGHSHDPAGHGHGGH